MTKITVPRKISGVRRRLGDLDGLLTAGEWERAAIVWAFTQDEASLAVFSRLDIKGLTKKATVLTYRDAWSKAIADGHAEPALPGETVKLPTIDWPRTRTGTDGYSSAEGAERTLERIIERHGPAIVAKQAARPDVARAIARNDEVLSVVEQAGSEHRGRFLDERLHSIDEDRAGRMVAHGISRRLGDDDVVTELRRAAHCLAEAIWHRNEFGVTDHEGEAEALARIERLLAGYRNGTGFSDEDAGWLASFGIGEEVS